ncbi:family 16 glycoside hydrolase [Alienimonas sp. DA493]|uniref:family 16 glycoside hydrolase n=1 Tax=Alienimonas sp. DA493 TaxID=3373605 RepID=UPI0037550D89
MPRRRAHAEGFDPYRKWLGIPPHRRPPTYYDLLGIDPGEDDPETIEAAAARRKAFLRAEFGGTRDDLARQLTYEIEEARFGLQDPRMRAQHDRRFGKNRNRNRSSVVPATPWFRAGGAVGESSGIAATFATIFVVLAVGCGTLVWLNRPAENAVAKAPAAVHPAPAEPAAPEPAAPEPAAPEPAAPERDAAPIAMPASAPEPAVLRPLDGDSLSAWTLADPEVPNVWSLRNGTLVRRDDVGGQLSGRDLFSVAEFQDFDLSTEFRLRGERANSGLYLRGRWEISLLDDVNVPDPTKRTGGVFQQVAPDRARFRYRPGEWNTLRCRLVGRTVDVWLNDAQIVTGHRLGAPTGGSLLPPEVAPVDGPGPVVLQAHRGTAEFRDMTIAPLGGGAVKPIAADELRRRLAGSEWKNQRGVDFTFGEDGTFRHGARPLRWSTRDGRTAEIFYEPDRSDVLTFNADLTRFEQVVGDASNARFTGRRLGAPVEIAATDPVRWVLHNVTEEGVSAADRVRATDGGTGLTFLPPPGGKGPPFGLLTDRRFGPGTLRLQFWIPKERPDGTLWVGVAATPPTPDGEGLAAYPQGLETRFKPGEIGKLVVPTENFPAVPTGGANRNKRSLGPASASGGYL